MINLVWNTIFFLNYPTEKCSDFSAKYNEAILAYNPLVSYGDLHMLFRTRKVRFWALIMIHLATNFSELYITHEKESSGLYRKFN